MSEKEWVAKYLSGFTDGWEYIICCHLSAESLKQLDDGPLKKLINKYQTVSYKLENMLEDLGYEAG